jgi:hypothetical protein
VKTLKPLPIRPVTLTAIPEKHRRESTMLTAQRFQSERELQDYCIRVLRSKGIHCKAEVWNGDIRADIVTSRAVIECKKILDRDSIYQAYGQAQAYRQNLKRGEIWIVGQYQGYFILGK